MPGYLYQLYGMGRPLCTDGRGVEVAAQLAMRVSMGGAGLCRVCV